MSSLGTEILGVIFLLVGTAATFLMFYQMGLSLRCGKSPQSSAPMAQSVAENPRLYLYFLFYLYMMWAMIPRLWTYQVELPARTVAHLVLGIAIGAILATKTSLVRWFKFLEKTLALIIGVALFICTVVLVGLALPSYAREAYLHRAAFSPERRDQLQGLLERAGLADAAAGAHHEPPGNPELALRGARPRQGDRHRAAPERAGRTFAVHD